VQHSQIVNLPAGYPYSSTFLHGAVLFTPDASAQNSQHDADFDSDMLIHEETSTGWHTISCVVMQLTSISNTGPAY
jgi:hypothetical protein